MPQQQTQARKVAAYTVSWRQGRLLALLHAVGGHENRIDFQKLLFLYCKQSNSSPPYSFVPYRYGAFSFTCYYDRRKLVEASLLVEGEDWRLTEEGHRVAARFEDASITSFAQEHEGFRGDELVAEAYRRYPYYAIRSEIVDRVLIKDRASRRRVEAARPMTPGSALFTIGCQGRTLGRILEQPDP